jgi:hypothetical protein
MTLHETGGFPPDGPPRGPDHPRLLAACLVVALLAAFGLLLVATSAREVVVAVPIIVAAVVKLVQVILYGPNDGRGRR